MQDPTFGKADGESNASPCSTSSSVNHSANHSNISPPIHAAHDSTSNSISRGRDLCDGGASQDDGKKNLHGDGEHLQREVASSHERVHREQSETAPRGLFEKVGIHQIGSSGTHRYIERPRPTFEHIYMRLAFQFARRSTCTRLNVGTVVTSTDFRKVLSVGYNGNASGLPNMCDRHEPGNCGCLHSEENAVINCDAPRFLEKLVFVTHLPCVMCAKRLINLGGVRKVYFAKEYRSRESLALFGSLGIETHHLPDERGSAWE